MGKAGQAQAKVDAKRAIKNKKKFKNRNSIGKAKKKTGSAGRFITRTMAVNKLQVSLKDFRKLCILKGIYPREPKKKFKGTNTTYFFAKDVQFLMHEPLLARFREQKAFLKKMRKAVGRHEKLKAKRLDSRFPVYKLDHLIRERFPTFVDALHELDDVLCLVVLFASLSPSKFVPAKRVEACARLRREFLAYVARTRALRYVFISIKGIYYQAEVSGVMLTWVEPHHSFAQQPTMQVDYRVMSSFLELYEAVLTFVNFKLYHDIDLSYPPAVDTKADDAGVHLGAAVMASKADAPAMATSAQPLALPPPPAAAKGTTGKSLSASQLASLRTRLRTVDAGDAEMISADGAGAAEGETAAGAGADATDFDAAMVEGATLSPDAAALRSLFASCVFYCGRETPLQSLEFIIVACGGRVGWDGDASPYALDDARITHQVIDRPYAGDESGAQRERVQPQWVYDCINARSLLPTYAYRPGAKCPPHLSPFADAAKGSEARERVRLAVMEATRAAGDDGEDAEDDNVDDAEDEGDEEDEEGEEEEESEDEDEDDEAARYRKELAAEVAGVAYAESSKSKTAKAAAGKRKAAPVASGGDSGKSEDKELAMMMMSRKKRRLYDRMQYGIAKKQAAEDKLQEKRDAIDAEAAKAKKTAKKKLSGV